MECLPFGKNAMSRIEIRMLTPPPEPVAFIEES
jgi:hypothetical protein